MYILNEIDFKVKSEPKGFVLLAITGIIVIMFAVLEMKGITEAVYSPVHQMLVINHSVCIRLNSVHFS